MKVIKGKPVLEIGDRLEVIKEAKNGGYNDVKKGMKATVVCDDGSGFLPIVLRFDKPLKDGHCGFSSEAQGEWNIPDNSRLCHGFNRPLVKNFRPSDTIFRYIGHINSAKELPA